MKRTWIRRLAWTISIAILAAVAISFVALQSLHFKGVRERVTARISRILERELGAQLRAEDFDVHPWSGFVEIRGLALHVPGHPDEPFLTAVPAGHPLAKRKTISAEELKHETMLLLGTGHCFRDHVLEVCPEYARFSSDAEGIRKSFEGSSLETIKYMVASGMGVTVVPQLSVPKEPQAHVRYIKFSAPVPTRRVVLAWRRTYTRYEAIAALRNCIYACELPGVTRLS